MPFDPLAFGAFGSGAAFRELKPQVDSICRANEEKFVHGWTLHDCTKDFIAQVEWTLVHRCGSKKGGPTFTEAGRLLSGVTINPMEALSGNATLVTAFFPIPSKHSLTTYEQWLKNLISLKDPLVLFTTTEWAEKLKMIRRGSSSAGPMKVVAMNLSSTIMASFLTSESLERQHHLDPERRIIMDPGVYWIWKRKGCPSETSIRRRLFWFIVFSLD